MYKYIFNVFLIELYTRRFLITCFIIYISNQFGNLFFILEFQNDCLPDNLIRYELLNTIKYFYMKKYS